MAASLPVVGSCFPEMKRIIEGYDLGETFDPDDPKDIAEVITSVLSDKERYDRMRENALRAAKDFNWENESKKFLNIYRILENQFQGTSVK